MCKIYFTRESFFFLREYFLNRKIKPIKTIPKIVIFVPPSDPRKRDNDRATKKPKAQLISLDIFIFFMFFSAFFRQTL